MQVKLTSNGEILFLDGDHLNRNSLNRKTLIVTPQTALATRESIWVQFGDDKDYENANANILEPIRLSEVEGNYKIIIPDEVIKKPGTWYMTLAVRMYSTNGAVYTEQLTSDKVSFTVNDSFPVSDREYASNGTIEDMWQQILFADQTAKESAESAAESAAQAQTAQAGAEAARAAAVASAENAQAAKNEAFVSAADAKKYLEDVYEAKDQVSDYRDEVETAIIYIRNMGLEIAQDVTNTENSASAAASSASAAASSASAAAQSAGQSAHSALQAQEYAQQAQEYAQKHYEIVASYDALPQPGNSAYIYLVPSSTASGANNYEEYLWITNTSSYEFIGTTSDIDLSNYAQVNGTYSGMTVGAVLATQLTNQDIHDLQGPEYWGKTYFGAGRNTVQNKPEGVDGFYLEVLRGGTSSTIHRLIATADTSGESVSPNIYIEQYITSWSSWEEVATSDGTYNGMTVGNATNAYQLGGIAASNYAQIDGSYAGLGAGSLEHVTRLGTGANLNDCIPTDSERLYVWSCWSGAEAANIENIPSGLTGTFYLLVYKTWAGDTEQKYRIVQTLYECGGNKGIYQRSIDNSSSTASWGQWQKLAYSNGIYPTMGAGLDGDGNQISTTYAKQTGNYPDLGAGYLAKSKSFATDGVQQGWVKIGTVPMSTLSTYIDYSCVMLIHGIFRGSSANEYSPKTSFIEIEARKYTSSLGDQRIGILNGDIPAEWLCFSIEDNLDMSIYLYNNYIEKVAFTFEILSEHASSGNVPLNLNIFQFSEVVTSISSAPEGAVYAVVRNNASYADQAGNAATATDSEKLGGVLATEYAINTGTYTGMTVGKAVNDGEGNNIVETYLTKVAAGTAAPLYEHTFYYQGKAGIASFDGNIALYVSCLSHVDHAPRTDRTEHTFEDIINILCGTTDPVTVDNTRVTASGFASGNLQGSSTNTNIFYMVLHPMGITGNWSRIDVVLGTTNSANDAFSNDWFFTISTYREYVEVLEIVKNWKVKAV